MKRIVILGISALVLTACTTNRIPDSGEGVGFNDYAEYELERARREAELRGETAPADFQGTSGFNDPVGVTTSDLAAAGIEGGDIEGPDVVAGGTNGAGAPLGDNSEISDEQSFSAVTSRESIESDAERRTRQAEAYQLIQATALPDRTGNAEPNIVQYALQAPNDLGESVFNRAGLSGESRFVRNCAKYRTPDAAQRDFIIRGGPQRDGKGLDPDGDGFACGWDPQPFRTLASGN